MTMALQKTLEEFRRLPETLPATVMRKLDEGRRRQDAAFEESDRLVLEGYAKRARKRKPKKTSAAEATPPVTDEENQAEFWWNDQ